MNLYCSFPLRHKSCLHGFLDQDSLCCLPCQGVPVTWLHLPGDVLQGVEHVLGSFVALLQVIFDPARGLVTLVLSNCFPEISYMLGTSGIQGPARLSYIYLPACGALVTLCYIYHTLLVTLLLTLASWLQNWTPFPLAGISLKRIVHWESSVDFHPWSFNHFEPSSQNYFIAQYST